MADILKGLLEEFGAKEFGRFKPHARYHAEMDQLVYYAVDCAYRADRIDPFLTVFLDPKEDTVVGVKFKGFRHIFEKYMQGKGKAVDFVPLIGIIEQIMECHGAKLVASSQRRYDQARECIRQVYVTKAELGLTSAATAR